MVLLGSLTLTGNPGPCALQFEIAVLLYLTACGLYDVEE